MGLQPFVKQIIDAFLREDGGVRTCHAGGEPGYTHIHGPHQMTGKELGQNSCRSHSIVIENAVATVSFRERLGMALGAESRNKQKISADNPRGIYHRDTAHPFCFTASEIADYESLELFARTVVEKCKELGTW